MKFKDMEIDMKAFYIMGMICFGVVAFANFGNLITNWDVMHVWGKISTFAYGFFNVVLVLFFNYLYNRAPTSIPKEDLPDEDELNKLMEKLK